MVRMMMAGASVIHSLTPPPLTTTTFRRRILTFPTKPPPLQPPSLSLSRSNFRFRTFCASHPQQPVQVDFSGSKGVVMPTSASVLSFAKAFWSFTIANLLPIALVAGVVLGVKIPALGCLAHKYSLSRYITSWLFFVSGLKMQDGELNAVVEAWPAFLYGLVFILLVSPFFSKLILKLQLAPREFVIGLAIISCMPTTLNGGVALTQLVGGNSALALALTVTSVLLGMFTVPLWITKFFADGFGVSIPTRQLLQNLLLILVVPLIIGKVLRNSFPDLARAVDENGRFFSITTSILLGLFPWMQVSKSRHLLMMVKPAVFVCAVGLGILVHLNFLVCNAILMKILSANSSPWKSVFGKKENSRALMLVCSQRSLLVATAIIEQVGGLLGESGLLVLPCVAADVNQIIVDSLLVNFWIQKDQSDDIAKKP